MTERGLLTLLIKRGCKTMSTLLFAAVASANAAAPQLPAVDSAMQKFVDDHEISGAVMLVADHGKIVHLGTVGMADSQHQRPMTADTMFGIMSMTKPITATAVMILKEEGKLAYDDPVEKYIPSFAAAKLKSGEPVHGLTIRSLITHTSGLVGEQTTEGSLEATAEMLAKRPFGYQPGEKWEYSPGLNVCGRIIEIVSGQPYDQFLAERIFQPLEMNDTTFHLTTEQRARIALVYKRSKSSDTGSAALTAVDREYHAGEPDVAAAPSGGLLSTAGDLDRFYQMVLNGGELDGHRILSAAGVREMTTIQTGDIVTGFTPGNGWGLGWCVVREPQGVTATLSPGTFGHGGKYGTQGWVDPVKQRIFVLLIQRFDIGNGDASDIRKDFQQAAVDALDRP
jgi:CubicO group peptidase (beta-lactamase class C family)